MPGSDRRGSVLTTDLLEVWTDPDTAMEAVGSSLGVFDEPVSSPARVLAANAPLRNTIYGVLLSLVEGGALEMRPCGYGRYAFRWRAELAPAVVDEPVAPVAVPELESEPEPHVDGASRLPGVARLSRPVMEAAFLAFPTVSCILAVVAYLTLGHAVAVVAVAVLAVAGVIGVARRVPFAGSWTIGLVVAALLLRLS